MSGAKNASIISPTTSGADTGIMACLLTGGMSGAVMGRGERMRLIDADRLLEERRMHTYYHLPNGDTAIPIIDIQNAPTVEPEQKAHWINVRGDNIADCDRCNARGRAWMNFCPVCGADMRGEQDG